MRLVAAIAPLVLTFTAASAASIEDAAPFTVRGSEKGVAMTSTAQILEDRGALTLSQARAAGTWRGPPESLAFAFSKSTWWVRWRVVNASDKSLSGVVDLGHPCQDFAQWFVVRQGGQAIDVRRTGDRLPFAERALPVHTLALPLRLAPREEVELYMRLQSYDGLFEPLSVKYFESREFFAANSTENLLTTLYYGALLALALYNLLLYFATRERSFGAYALYALCFLTWNFTFRGYAFQYLWPESPAFNNDFLTVGVALTFASIGWFAVVYLRMRETTPRWVYRLNMSLVAVNLSVIGVAMSGQYALGAAISQVLGVVLIVVTQSTAIWLLRRGSRQARFFSIAFALITVGVGAYILQIVDLVPANWFTTWAIQIGSALEMLLLALGVADSMNTLKAQALLAERRAREAQEALNVRLAQEVNERTEELAAANRRLHDLAITDELTGAFNRRHFTAFCGATLMHRNRGEPLAFCMFDLDRFKEFNEGHGQRVGDETLRAVARAVNRELRGSGDVLFRLGGEEFGVLYKPASPEAARDFAERLRKTIHDLAIVHPNGDVSLTSKVLTASFGVGWWGGDAVDRVTPDQLYAAADNMLYEAKEAGRDCVRLDVRLPASTPETLQSIWKAAHG